MSRPRPVSGVNHIAPTRLADGKASLDPLRSVQFNSVQLLSKPGTPGHTHTHRQSSLHVHEDDVVDVDFDGVGNALHLAQVPWSKPRA